MNAYVLARSAYAGSTSPVRTDRGTEYEAFSRCTHALSDTRSAEAGFPALARALHDNRRLWNALAADVSNDANGLPVELRARLFYLAEFTQQHSRKVLAGEADVGALIDINMAVMRGLRGQEVRT